jgi:hypothetical protein
MCAGVRGWLVKGFVVLAGAMATAAEVPEKSDAINESDGLADGGKLAVGVTSSSQDNIVISNS